MLGYFDFCQDPIMDAMLTNGNACLTLMAPNTPLKRPIFNAEFDKALMRLDSK